MMRLWSILPLFWRFQLAGWVTYVLLSFPLKVVLFGSFRSAIIVTIGRDGLILLLTAGMREIYRRTCLDWTRLFHIFIVTFVTSTLAGLILTGFSFALYHVFGFREEVAMIVKTGFRIFYTHAGLCFSWSLLYFGIKSIRETAARDVQLARAEVGLREAELQVLKTQINPHFLFNALNTIIAALGKPGQHARELVQAFAEYLHYSLKHRDSTLVPLQEELAAIESYLTVEKARYREDLEIENAINPATREVLVPGVLIQPLIENAIKYGKKTSPRPLRIRLAVARANNGSLRLDVSNTGRWVPETIPDEAGGIGMANLRQRLSAIYGEKHTLSATEENGWVRVRVEIPATP